MAIETVRTHAIAGISEDEVVVIECVDGLAFGPFAAAVQALITDSVVECYAYADGTVDMFD